MSNTPVTVTVEHSDGAAPGSLLEVHVKCEHCDFGTMRPYPVDPQDYRFVIALTVAGYSRHRSCECDLSPVRKRVSRFAFSAGRSEA